MHTDSTHVMPWRIEDIDLARIDRRKAASNEHLLLLLCAASFIESGTEHLFQRRPRSFRLAQQ